MIGRQAAEMDHGVGAGEQVVEARGIQDVRPLVAAVGVAGIRHVDPGDLVSRLPELSDDADSGAPFGTGDDDVLHFSSSGTFSLWGLFCR